jgi:ornithine cyclodeaminase/alanine dehydrogenase-like protein (mu-crystallin family)
MALVLGDADVRAALSPEECERAMVQALVADADGRASFPLRTVFAPGGAGGFLGLMPAHMDGDGARFGLKAVCLIAANHGRDLDVHQGMVALFSGETGAVTAILNAAPLTEIRTAAVTAAATRALARPDAAVLAILGAGVQARAHLRALRGIREWTEVRIASRTSQRADALVAAAGDLIADGSDARPSISRSSSVAAALDGADVVVCATTSSEPILQRAWLCDGAHVNAIGASSPSSRELDVDTVAAAELFCDSRESLFHEALEFRLAIEQGAIAGPDHVRAELGEVLAGRHPGRRSADELTVFRSLGVGVEDLAAGRLAVRRARERGLGTEVAL